MKSMVDVQTGKIFLLDEIDGGDAGVTSDESVNTLAEQTTTLRNDLDDLGDQVLGIQGDVNIIKAAYASAGSHFDKWVLMGVPDPVNLTTSLQKIPFPVTTRFPSLPPESMELNAEGNGIIFKKPGLVHVKRNVSLGGSNTKNLYYEARINDQTLEPLQAQAVSVSENTMSFSIEFYWQVTMNQEFSIWGNCVSGEIPLNYKGVCMMFEYL